MTDLSKYDAAIVEAAERYAVFLEGRTIWSGELPRAILTAVQAKRRALAPKCAICHQPATNAIVWAQEDRTTRYCDFHEPEKVRL